MSRISPNSTPPRSKRIQVQGMLRWSHDTLPVQVLIDSGADDSFIDYELVSQANIPTIALSEPQEVLALDGKQLARVTHRTEPISLTLSDNHHELIELFVISSPMSPVIVGLPWLKIHNPLVDWSTASIVNWSVFCHANCLRSAIPTSVPTSQSPPEEIDLSAVPSEYHDLKQVFSKDKALSLPPHRPYDCAIDLLPGSPLPSKKLYNLSKPEKEAMEAYIQT